MRLLFNMCFMSYAINPLLFTVILKKIIDKIFTITTFDVQSPYFKEFCYIIERTKIRKRKYIKNEVP